MNPDVIIEIRNVKKCFALGSEAVWALRGVNLDIFKGEFLSIMGPSGSGKSTLFNQIGALDTPTEGHVSFMGMSILKMTESQQAWFRCHKIGYIFQTFNLIPVMSALQNVMLPILFNGAPREDAQRQARAILERVGLGHRLTHKPFELSGGQQQRVAIARALANKPDVVLADEPTGNLDNNTGAEIVELLHELNQENNVTIVCSTHDPKMIRKSDRVCWIRDGRLDQITKGSEFVLEMMKGDRHG